jgi:hypothetical protein
MTDDTTLPFWFPAIRGRKLAATFNGGRLSLDGGVMLLDLQPAGWMRRCADECPYPELVEG